ncbi:hypothetical protein NMY22_g11949 [Coprinellus aureogranulatus]|nr:hypothetical protein NMY22_g11949 [Coprinellus aureogranulatus]
MESPFEHLIACNYVPTEQEAGVISQLLIEPTKELAKMDDRIQDMKRQLDKAQASRDRLWNSVMGHRGMISCARRIPDDILREIFVETLPTTYLPTVNANQSPTVLTHICGRWRKVALSTPHLWSGIHVKLPDPSGGGGYTKDDRDRKVSHIGEWISRAHAIPITISFGYGASVTPVMSCLRQSSPSLQWGGFRSSFRVEDQPFSLFDSIQGDPDSNPLRSAERLSPDIARFSRDAEGLQKFLMALNLSSNRRLRSLALRYNFHDPSFDFTAFIPCSNLQYLHFGTCNETTRLDIPSLARVVKQCLNLRVLRTLLDIGEEYLTSEFNDFREEGIVHHRMREVSFSMRHIATDGEVIARLLPMMFPSISISHLSFTANTTNYLQHHEPAFPTHSLMLRAASLTALTIHPLSFPETDFISVLSGLTSLVQLHLLGSLKKVDFDSDRIYGPEVIRFLSPAQGSDYNTIGEAHGCPRLRYLKLGKRSSNIDTLLLPGLLHGRPVPLRQCHIHFMWRKESMPPGNDAEEYAALIGAGLDLRLRYGNEIDSSLGFFQGGDGFPQMESLSYGWPIMEQIF